MLLYLQKSFGKFEHENINIYGIGFDNFTCETMDLSEISKDLDTNKKNILIMHAAVDASIVLEKSYNPITLNTLKSLNMDYIALRTYS